MESKIEKAKSFVSKLLSEQLNPNLLYHNLNHTLSVYQSATEIANALGINGRELEEIQLAALFHDTGFIDTYLGHEKRSCEIAEEFLSNEGLNKDIIDKIKRIILCTDMQNQPNSLEEKIIRDADISYLGEKNMIEHSNLLREEWKLVLDRKYTDKEWYEINIEFLKNHHFFTEYADKKFSHVKDNFISYYEQKLRDNNLNS